MLQQPVAVGTAQCTTCQYFMHGGAPKICEQSAKRIFFKGLGAAAQTRHHKSWSADSRRLGLGMLQVQLNVLHQEQPSRHPKKVISVAKHSAVAAIGKHQVVAGSGGPVADASLAGTWAARIRCKRHGRQSAGSACSPHARAWVACRAGRLPAPASLAETAAAAALTAAAAAAARRATGPRPAAAAAAA